jgi:hypothetical protein
MRIQTPVQLVRFRANVPVSKAEYDWLKLLAVFPETEKKALLAKTGIVPSQKLPIAGIVVKDAAELNEWVQKLSDGGAQVVRNDQQQSAELKFDSLKILVDIPAPRYIVNPRKFDNK